MAFLVIDQPFRFNPSFTDTIQRNPVRLLTGTEIQHEVANIMSRTGKVMAAVAYWGEGASERTGIARNKRRNKAQVICDLLSGACNPAEIEKLMRLDVQVKTLDRLHAKVWIGGSSVILGSANASKNGLPDTNRHTTTANVEAAILSSDRNFSQETRKWFEALWKKATAIDKDILDRARTAWEHRNRFSGRAFTATLMHRFWAPQPPTRLSGLRLVAYLEDDWSTEAKRFLKKEAMTHYTEEEWTDLKGEAPFYEWPLRHPEWTARAGTVLMDFSCKRKGGTFTFNGFWSVRDCKPVTLANSRLTLLTRLPHFNGYAISAEERAWLAKAIGRFVTNRKFRTDPFNSYIDMDLLEFCRTESSILKRRLVQQAVEMARDLCRTGQFDSALTLNTIRRCKHDPTWLGDYARYVRGPIYENGNPRKREINLELGRRVRAGIGATIQTDDNGKRAKVEVTGEIIRSYTPLVDFDRKSVAA